MKLIQRAPLGASLQCVRRSLGCLHKKEEELLERFLVDSYQRSLAPFAFTNLLDVDHCLFMLVNKGLVPPHSAVVMVLKMRRLSFS